MIRFLILFLVCSFAHGQMLIDVYKVDEGGASPTELYTTANAISTNESSGSSGISVAPSGTFSIVTGGAANGTYYAKLISTSASTGQRMEVAWSGLTISQAYTFSFKIKKVGGNAALNVWTNVDGLAGDTAADPGPGGTIVSVTEETWTTYSYNLIPTSTSGIARFYASDTVDSEVHVDEFSIIEYNP